MHKNGHLYLQTLKGKIFESFYPKYKNKMLFDNFVNMIYFNSFRLIRTF